MPLKPRAQGQIISDRSAVILLEPTCIRSKYEVLFWGPIREEEIMQSWLGAIHRPFLSRSQPQQPLDAKGVWPLCDAEQPTWLLGLTHSGSGSFPSPLLSPCSWPLAGEALGCFEPPGPLWHSVISSATTQSHDALVVIVPGSRLVTQVAPSQRSSTVDGRLLTFPSSPATSCWHRGIQERDFLATLLLLCPLAQNNVTDDPLLSGPSPRADERKILDGTLLSPTRSRLPKQAPAPALVSDNLGMLTVSSCLQN